MRTARARIACGRVAEGRTTNDIEERQAGIAVRILVARGRACVLCLTPNGTRVGSAARLGARRSDRRIPGCDGMRGGQCRARARPSALQKLTQRTFRQTSADDRRTELWLKTGARRNSRQADNGGSGNDGFRFAVPCREHICRSMGMLAVACMLLVHLTARWIGRRTPLCRHHRHPRQLRIAIMRVSNEPLAGIHGEAADDEKRDETAPAIQR